MGDTQSDLGCLTCLASQQLLWLLLCPEIARQVIRPDCTVISSNTGDTPNTKAMFCYPLLNITSLLLSWLYFGKLNYTLNHDLILFEFVRVCVLPLQLSVCKDNSLFLQKKIFYQIKTVIDLTVLHSPPHLNSSCVPKKTNFWI